MDQSKEFEEILAWYDIVPTTAQRELFCRAIMIIDNASDGSWAAMASWHELLSGIGQSRARARHAECTQDRCALDLSLECTARPYFKSRAQ
jgi:hypothetical protein